MVDVGTSASRDAREAGDPAGHPVVGVAQLGEQHRVAVDVSRGDGQVVGPPAQQLRVIPPVRLGATAQVGQQRGQDGRLVRPGASDPERLLHAAQGTDPVERAGRGSARRVGPPGARVKGGGCARRSGRDVLVEAEEVRRVPAALERHEAVVRRAWIGMPDALGPLAVQEVGIDARGARRDELVHPHGPGLVHGHLPGVGRRGDHHGHQPRGAVRERGGVGRDPAHRATQDAQLDEGHLGGRGLDALDEARDGRVIDVVEERRTRGVGDGLARLLGQAVDGRVGHRRDHVAHGRRDGPDGGQGPLAGLGVADPRGEHDERRGAVVLGRHERQRRDAHEDRDEREAVGRSVGDLDDLAHHVDRRRQRDGTAQEPVHGVESEREARGDAEVAAAAPDAPEQLRLVRGVDRPDLAVGGHDIGGDERVDGHAVGAREPADAAARDEAAKADRAGVPERGAQAVGDGRRGVLPGAQARPGDGDARGWVDVEGAQVAQVEQQRTVGAAVAGQAVAAAPDGERDVVLTREAHRCGDVPCVGGPDDRQGLGVVAQVPRTACLVPGGEAGQHDVAVESGEIAREGSVGRVTRDDGSGGVEAFGDDGCGHDGPSLSAFVVRGKR